MKLLVWISDLSKQTFTSDKDILHSLHLGDICTNLYIIAQNIFSFNNKMFTIVIPPLNIEIYELHLERIKLLFALNQDF